MKLNRRAFGKRLGFAGLMAATPRVTLSAPSETAFKIGICDWTLGGACDPALIAKAREAHLNGIQVSVGLDPDNVPLREERVRRRYIELGKKHGIVFHSVAAGRLLNQIPLKSEPQSAVYVIDALEAAKALGSTNILMAFFGKGDLRSRDANGELKNLSKSAFSSYQLDHTGVDRVVAALRQIAPRAEDLGVVMGLENTLTAKQNLEIMDRVSSEMLQVYYDVGNSWGNGYDVPGEILMLGNNRICEIHLKDRESRLLGTPEGQVQFEKVAEACRKIGYDKWYVLETRGRENRFLEDTRYHAAFAKEVFG